MDLLERLFKRTKPTTRKGEKEYLDRQITALFKLLSGLYGEQQLVIKAGKFEALELMRSNDTWEQVVALKRIMEEDPTIHYSSLKGTPLEEILFGIEDHITDMMAYRKVEDRLERKLSEKMQERQQQYMKELKRELFKENEGRDNARTLKKYAELEKLEHRSLSQTTLQLLRPATIHELVGQEKALRSLLSKIASPYPQHVLIYGPPGVGKTTAARLALEEAKRMSFTPFEEGARFVEVDGTTLRWDPREVTNPLLGSVHDPIYQGAKRGLAQEGIPEPKTGLVTEAHGGVLFIDEIGELDPMLQNKLLKVLEDKRVIFDSSYYDPDGEHIPQYIKKLFEDGAPADFLLIGATTRQPEEMSPALRSRAAEIFFEPLTPPHIEEILLLAAKRLKVVLPREGARIISYYTTEGRKAINILADAYGLCLYEQEKGKKGGQVIIGEDLIREVLQQSRLRPKNQVEVFREKAIGRILGLGVIGYMGSVIEIEAIAFPALEKGKGELRFNETAGSMARDSLFNASCAFRHLLNQDIRDFDLHVNIVGGGNIDGPSAGAAILLAIISAVEEMPLPQDMGITGELSIKGRLKPVGGIVEKLYGAFQAGLKEVFIPKGNEGEVPKDYPLKVRPVSSIQEVLKILGHQKKRRVS